jgi:ribosomal protein L13E
MEAALQNTSNIKLVEQKTGRTKTGRTKKWPNKALSLVVQPMQAPLCTKSIAARSGAGFSSNEFAYCTLETMKARSSLAAKKCFCYL